MISRRLQIILAVLVFSALALGYYALRLKRRVEAVQTVTLDTRPMTPPVSGVPQAVRIFVADDRDGSIHERQLSIALPASPASSGAGAASRTDRQLSGRAHPPTNSATARTFAAFIL